MARPKRMADCHPHVPHCAKGFCRACYLRIYLPKWFGKRPGKATEYKQRWRRKHPEKDQQQRMRHRERTRSHYKWLRWKYGLTEEAYDQALADQQYACAICKAETLLVVDHNHGTNQVRGLLCNDCNYGLGRFKDDVGRLLRAADYLTGIREEVEIH